MAKRRGRAVSIDGLLSTLKNLDKQREQVTARLKSALSTALSGVPSPFSPLSAATSLRGRHARTGQTKRTRKRRGMSAAQRKAVSARMKKYWAERRKSKGNK